MLEVVCPHCQARVAVPVQLQGHTVMCATCQRSFQTVAPTPQTSPHSATPLPLPPHLAAPQPPHTQPPHTQPPHTQPGMESTPPPPAAAGETPEEETRPNAAPQQTGQSAWVVCCLLLLASAIAAISYFNPLKLRRATPQPSATQQDFEEIVVDPSQSEVRWSVRDDVWLVLNRRKVRLRNLKYGPVRIKDGMNTVRVSDRKYLQVHLRLMNATTDTPTYSSWFQLGKASTARLDDDQGRSYPTGVLADADRVQGHTPRASMTPLEPIDDVLLFEFPADVGLSEIRYLRLTLPAAAWGEEGELRFQIAHDRIITTS